MTSPLTPLLIKGEGFGIRSLRLSRKVEISQAQNSKL